MKTSTEKYNAVLEGTLSKAEFVRQMRLAHPNLISQFNGYADTVQILINRGMIYEAKQEEKGYQKLNVSLEAIERGIHFELLGAGLDPFGKVSEDDYNKAKSKAEKNLEKDTLFYINKLADIKPASNRDDIEKETKRGALDVDKENGLEKASLKEAKVAGHTVNKSEEKHNIIAVAREIRAKYGDMPDFNKLLKDFLQMHMDRVKSGKVTNPVADFDNFLDDNNDRLDEKDHDGYNTDPNTTMHIDDEEWEEEMGRSVKEEKDEDHDEEVEVNTDADFEREQRAQLAGRNEEVNEMSPEAADAIAFLTTAAGIKGASHIAGKLLAALEAGKLGEKGKALAQDIHNLSKEQVQEEEVNERVGGKDDIIELIKARAMNATGDEQAEVLEVTEFMARHYFGNDLYEFLEQFTQEVGIDIEFGRLGDTLEEEYSVFKSYDDIISGISSRLGALKKYVSKKEPGALEDLQQVLRAFEIFDEKMAYGAHMELEENDADYKKSNLVKESIKSLIKSVLNEGMGRVAQLDSSYYAITNLLHDIQETPGIFTNLKIDFSGWYDQAESGDGKVHRQVTVYPDGYNHKDAAFSIYDYKESFDPGAEENVHKELRWSIGGYSGALAPYLAQELGFDINEQVNENIEVQSDDENNHTLVSAHDKGGNTQVIVHREDLYGEPDLKKTFKISLDKFISMLQSKGRVEKDPSSDSIYFDANTDALEEFLGSLGFNL